MPKQFFVIEKISEAEYFKRAKEAGKPDSPHLVRYSESGYVQLDKKTYLAYTEEDTLEVGLEQEDE